jgi:hypothetical protein
MQNTNCHRQANALVCPKRARLRRAALLALAIVAALIPPRAAAQVSTTTVQGTIYRADGTPASGTVLISWPAFTTAQSQAIAAGNLSTAIGANGFLSVSLTSNAGALPGGSYYTAVYHLSDGTVNQEYWVVPAAATATVAAVRAQLQPSTVAVQSVTPAYVASAVASVSSSYLPLSGGTLTGPLTLNSDPLASSQAATKHYADQLFAESLPLSGGTVAGPLNTQQMEGALYADQWQKGAGNNGIFNSVQQCASLPYACHVVAPALYSLLEAQAFGQTGNYGAGLKDWLGSGSAWIGYGPLGGQNSPAAVFDMRYGVPQWFFNNAPAYPYSNGYDMASPAFVMNDTKFGSNAASWTASALNVQATAFMGGLNATNPNCNSDSCPTAFSYKNNFSAMYLSSWKYTSTQNAGDLNQTVKAFGNGDNGGHGIVQYAWGGPSAASDEGTETTRYQTYEGSTEFSAAIAGITASADGSLVLATSSQVANNSQGEGRNIVDTTGAYNSGNNAYVSQITTPVSSPVTVTCSGNYCDPNVTGTTTQTALTAVLQCPGTAQCFPMSNAVISVASASGFAVGQHACIWSGDYDCETITAVNAASNQITLATARMPQPLGAWVTTGGLTGYGFSFTADNCTSTSPSPACAVVPPSGQTIRWVTPILTSSGNQVTLFSGYNFLPGAGGETYTGRAYTLMGGSGGSCSVTVSGGAVTAASVSGGTGYISPQYPPQLVLSGLTWTTAPQIEVTGVSGSGALTSAAIVSPGSGIAGTPACTVATYNPYVIYPMAKTYQVYNPATGQVDGTLWVGPPSGSFSNGDSIEQPHWFIQRHNFGTEANYQDIPAHTSEPDSGFDYLTYGLQGNDIGGATYQNLTPPAAYYGYPSGTPGIAGLGQWNAPFAIRLTGPYNSGLYFDTPPYGSGPSGFKGAAAVVIDCLTHGCSQWTNGYGVLNAVSTIGSDMMSYNPTTQAWSLSAGSTSYGGSSPYCSLNLTGSSTGGLALACKGTSTQFDTHGNLSLPGSLHAQTAVTGAVINGEITVDGVTYTSLNAAWNAAVSQAITTSQNQTIRLGPGTFPVTATLNEPANGACVNLLGSAGTTMNADSLQIATTLTIPAALRGDVVFLGNATQAQGCTFRDLSILAAGNATHGFELQWLRGALIDNVAVNDTTAEGVLLGEETTSSGHQTGFLLRNVTVSYSSAAFTPASRAAYGIHLQKTAMDSHLDDIVVRNALTAAVWNEGTGNTGYLIHGFGYPYTCTTAPCANNASSGSATNASYATNYVIYDTGGAGSVWTDTYADSPAVAGFYIGADGVAIHGGHIQWPDLTSFPAANLAYVAANVSNNLLIADVDCLEMAGGVNWITYAGTAGNPPTYASVHHLTGCGNYYQSLEPANTTGFSSGGANINDPSGAVPRLWSTPIAAASSYPAFSAQMYTGYQGDAFQAHFSGVSPFFNVTYQGTIRSNGGIALGTIINTASTLTLTPANKNVIANAAGGPQTLTLPSCYTPLGDNAMPTGLEFTIVKSDTSSNTVTLTTTSSELIYSQGTGAATLVLSAPSTQTLVCGPDYNWYVAGAAAAAVSGVTSFNGRTGAIVPQSGDYAADYDALGAAAAAQSNAEAFSANASNISSGKLPHAQLPALLSTDIPNNAASTTGNAATATALAATPSQCPTGYYAVGITTSGAANCLQSWHFTWYGTFAGTFGTATNSSLGAIWSPTASLTMTRLDIAIGTAPAGCTTYPVIGVYDSTAAAWLKTVTLASGTYSYRNAVTGVSITAGHNLSMGVQTAGSGCSTNPGTAQLTMEYTMNQ